MKMRDLIADLQRLHHWKWVPAFGSEDVQRPVPYAYGRAVCVTCHHLPWPCETAKLLNT